MSDIAEAINNLCIKLAVLSIPLCGLIITLLFLNIDELNFDICY